MNARFRFPGAADRTTIIGATGSGKTSCGLWLLSHQRFDRRPWIALDFKREAAFDQLGFPPAQALGLGRVPGKKNLGLYVVSPHPGEEDEVDAWLWKVWERENIGLYIDEAMNLPKSKAMRAILQQGRSKRIPVIACTQRPVEVARQFFSEASYFCIYRLQDDRDYDTVKGFVPAGLASPLPRYHWWWYGVNDNQWLRMGPVPRPEDSVARLGGRVPFSWSPFSWGAPPVRPA